MTRITIDPSVHIRSGERSVAGAYRQLASSQKPAARSAPAYSRFVNRRIGRALAAVCWTIGLTPNAVTVISATFTFAAIAALALYPPSVLLGVIVSAGLLIGYAFDSADGQVARLSGASSPAGEWLDHVVDATKAAALPLALGVGLYRADAVDDWWLLVPLAASIVSSVLFFSMILTEQLRRQHSTLPLAPPASSPRALLRSIAVAPMDYGLLCLSFVLLGALPVFLVVYTFITVATAGFVVLSSVKWFTELRGLSSHQGLEQGGGAS